MNILYDDHIFTYQRYGGISRYFYELMSNAVFGDYTPLLPYLVTNNEYLQDSSVLKLLHVQSKTNYVARKAWLQEFNRSQSIRLLRRSQKYQVFHPTYYTPYFLDHIGRTPFLLTIHDMIHERMGKEFAVLGADKELIEAKALLAKKASKIIAVSEATKMDIMELLHIPEEKIRVVYHGSSFAHTNSNSFVPSWSNYLLYVGNRGFYKNFIPYLNAIAPLLKKRNQTLVCAGGGKASAEEKALVEQLRLQQLVRFVSFNSNEELAAWYANAISFVFPSRYEGFGIPLLEAFASHCPCLVAEATALPEIAGDAALYFSPTDTAEMLHKTEQILDDHNLRSQLVEKGIQQLAKFSWNRTAQQTGACYQAVLW